MDGSIKFKNPNNANRLLYRMISGIMDTIHIFYFLIAECLKQHTAVIHITTPSLLSLSKEKKAEILFGKEKITNQWIKTIQI